MKGHAYLIQHHLIRQEMSDYIVRLDLKQHIKPPFCLMLAITARFRGKYVEQKKSPFYNFLFETFFAPISIDI
jgi:hypothetical protein